MGKQGLFAFALMSWAMQSSPAMPEGDPAAGQAAFLSWRAVFAELFREAGEASKAAEARALRCLATVEGALLLARVQQSPELLRSLVAACGENYRPLGAAEESAHE